MGINTTNPRALFHIDGLGNNNTTGAPAGAQVPDDVYVTTDGYIGLGIVAPTAKLEIRSATRARGLRLIDGSQNTGTVLTNSGNGYATWGNLALGAVAGTRVNTNVTMSTTYTYLNMHVNIPPGRSQVYVGGMVRNANALGYMTGYLAESSTSITRPANVDMTPGLAGFSINTSTSIGQVTFFLNNKNATSIDVYFVGRAVGATTGTWVMQGVGEPFIFAAY